VTDVLKELLLMTSLIQSTQVVVVDLLLCTLTTTLLTDVRIFNPDEGVVMPRFSTEPWHYDPFVRIEYSYIS
jgi:hypothetical protein